MSLLHEFNDYVNERSSHTNNQNLGLMAGLSSIQKVIDDLNNNQSPLWYYSIFFLKNSPMFPKLFTEYDIQYKVISGSNTGSIGRLTSVVNGRLGIVLLELTFSDGQKKSYQENKLKYLTEHEDITNLLKPSRDEIAPNDLLKRKIKLSDFVIYSSKSYGIIIGNITKISTEGKVYIKSILSKKHCITKGQEIRVEFPEELVILDDQTFKEFMLIKLQDI